MFATSNAMQISFVLEVIRQLNPGSVLDIGCGSGKYGVLTREYLPDARIDGIEGFTAYITDIHRVVYDNVYEVNAMEFVPKLDHGYDLAMMIDMFEHLERELDAGGFFFPPAKKDAMVRNIRAMILRAALTDQETRTIRGMIVALAKNKYRGQKDNKA